MVVNDRKKSKRQTCLHISCPTYTPPAILAARPALADHERRASQTALNVLNQSSIVGWTCRTQRASRSRPHSSAAVCADCDLLPQPFATCTRSYPLCCSSFSFQVADLLSHLPKAANVEAFVRKIVFRAGGGELWQCALSTAELSGILRRLANQCQGCGRHTAISQVDA